jgi:hypothetical protein
MKGLEMKRNLTMLAGALAIGVTTVLGAAAAANAATPPSCVTLKTVTTYPNPLTRHVSSTLTNGCASAVRVQFKIVRQQAGRADVSSVSACKSLVARYGTATQAYDWSTLSNAYEYKVVGSQSC